jgi:hypothetical protein
MNVSDTHIDSFVANTMRKIGHEWKWIIDGKSENEKPGGLRGRNENESKLGRIYKADLSATELGSSKQGRDRHKLTGARLKSIRFNQKYGFLLSCM